MTLAQQAPHTLALGERLPVRIETLAHRNARSVLPLVEGTERNLDFRSPLSLMYSS